MMHKTKSIVITVLLLMSSMSMIYSRNKFTFILIDNQLEHRYGKFPYDRSAYADMINAIYKYKPKSIIIKFFFDSHKTQSSDKKLAKAMKNRNIILEAALGGSDTDSRELDKRFSVKQHTNAGNKIKSTKGWIPIPILQKYASDVGFPMAHGVSYTNLIPLYVEYKGRDYKSLWLCALESAYDDLTIKNGEFIAGGNWKKKLTPDNYMTVNYSNLPDFSFTSMEDVFTGKVSPELIKNKVVILYYDKSPFLKTLYGRLRAHDVFNRVLLNIISATNQ